MPIVLGRVSEARLAQMAVAARGLEYSYREIGATRGLLEGRGGPEGYRADHYECELARDDEAFGRAAAGLRSWRAHVGSGARVAPVDIAPAIERSVVVAVFLPPVTVVAPCRVVYVTEEVDRFGFAYGTLRGHPESGEEAFHVVRANGTVRFHIDVFSRPSHALARAGAPVARALQARATRRYLTALRDFVGATAPA